MFALILYDVLSIIRATAFTSKVDGSYEGTQFRSIQKMA